MSSLTLSKINQATVSAHAAGYRVTDDGACLRPDGTPQKVHISDRGYYAFTYFVVRTRTPINVHRLAALQRFGAQALFVRGVEVRHLNGDRLNNTTANLALGNHSDNMLDQPSDVRNRKAPAAARVRRVLTPDEACELVRLSAAGWLGKDLAARFGVYKSTVSQILSGRVYGSVTGVAPRPPKKRSGTPTVATA